MKKMIAAVSGVLLASASLANDIKFSFVEMGINEMIGEDSDFESERDISETNFRVQGSVGIGPVFYIPAAIDSFAGVVEYNNCGGCEGNSYTITDVMVGGGAKFSLGAMWAIYGDLSLIDRESVLYWDEDFSDEYDTESDSGNRFRVGARFQPVHFFELESSVARLKFDDVIERWFELGGRFHFTKLLSAGVLFRRQTIVIDDAFYADPVYSYFGANFRFSFK